MQLSEKNQKDEPELFHAACYAAKMQSFTLVLLCQLMKPEENFSTGTRIFCHEDAKTQSFTKILCPAVFVSGKVDKVKLRVCIKINCYKP